MKSDKIFDILSNIDDDLLTSALGEQEKKNKSSFILKSTVAAAAVIAVVFALVLAISPFINKGNGGRSGSEPTQELLMNRPTDSDIGISDGAPTEAPVSIISDSTIRVYMKINPYICFDLNNDGQVTNIVAFNEDGEKLVSGYDFYGKPLENAALELIGQAEQMGYLTEDGQVTFSIDAPDYAAAEECNTVLTRVVSEQNKPFKISIRCLLALKEIKNLCAEHFGVSPEVVSFKELECHADHDVARYQIEFKYNDRIYSCKINAVTGEVYDIEIFDPSSTDSTVDSDDNVCDDNAENATTSAPSSTQAPGASKPSAAAKPTAKPVKTPEPAATPSADNTQTAIITEEQALKIALADAGVTEYSFEKIKLHGHTCEKHTAKYKVEFISGTTEYKYEIDTITGEITKSEIKENSKKATKA